jgi:hypothetical protein
VTTKETLEEEMGLAGVTFKRCGLLPEHIEKYSLPNNPDAVKQKDTRQKAFVAHYGNTAVELDAMPPNVLQELVRENIASELDMSRFEAEKIRETEDREMIEAFREEAVEAVMDCYSRFFHV